MPKFFTGNPLGSTDPRDLYDNADVFDDAINKPYNPDDDADSGEVETRFHGAIETLAKIFYDISHSDIGESSAAEINRKINGLIRNGGYITEPEVEQIVITDPDGGRLATLTDRRLTTTSWTIRADPAITAIADDEGNAIIYDDGTRTVIGSLSVTADASRVVIGDYRGATFGIALADLEIRHTDLPGFYVVDDEGGVLLSSDYSPVADPGAGIDPLADGMMFSPTIATSGTTDTNVYLRNLLPWRELADDVVANVASTTTDAMVTGPVLPLSATRFGAGAVLKLRRRTNNSRAWYMPLTLVDVPVQSPAVPVKILFIGDSIANWQGGTLLQKYLTDLGLTPTFIGTINSSANAASAADATGPLGEMREGWESGDFTGAITDRASVIAPGDEATYLAMSKANKLTRNPFLRAATTSDPTAIVRNGLVFDPAYYQSRFGLATPDIVINLLGTNDARDRPASTIFADILDADTLLHNQLRATWPSAKIIRSFPGTAYEASRNDVWTKKYFPMLRAIQQSARDRADPLTTVIPLWAMTDPEGGYNYNTDSPAPDGSFAAALRDATHPTGAARIGLYRAFAPFVAAAALNLI